MGANNKGRAPGSTNKDRTSFDYLFDKASKLHDFDIVDYLVGIASGDEKAEGFTKADRMTAAKMLLDKRFASKREHTGDIDSGIPDRIVISYDDSQRGKPVLAPVSAMDVKG